MCVVVNGIVLTGKEYSDAECVASVVNKGAQE